MVREGCVFTNPTSNGKASYGSDYYVTAYEPGAVVATGSSGNTIEVDAGHGFAANDKGLVFAAEDITRYFQVGSVTSIELTLAGGQTLSVAEGEILINLGPDTGFTEPNYDGSGAVVYTDMDYGNVALNSTVQTNDVGRYIYYHRGIAIWELVRTAAGVPFAVYQDAGDQSSVTGDVINVKDFNATGDGITDDKDALQAAMSAVPSTGGKVYLPAGTYIVSDAVWIKSNTHVYGDGIDVTTIKRQDNSLSATVNPNYSRNRCLTTGSDVDTPYTNASPGASITIADMTLDNNYTNQSLTAVANGAHCFGVSHTIGSDSGGCIDGLTIQRVKAQNSMQDGFYIQNCKNVLVDSCVTYKTGQTSAVTSKNGITFSGGPTDLANGWCTNLIATNNRVSYSGDATTRASEGIVCIVGDNLVVSGNDISFVDYGFEGTYTTSGAYTNYNWVISNNTIHDLTNASIAQVGITIGRSSSQPLKGCVVSGNTIYNVNQNGIISQFASDLSVTGNTIYKVNTVTDATYFCGIDIQSCAEAAVNSNVIHHVSPAAATYGVRMHTVTGGLVSGNTVINDNGSATGANLYLNQNTTECLVTGNRSIGNKYGVRISANGTNSGNVTIGNVITGTLTASLIDQSGQTNYDYGSLDAGALSIPGVLTTIGAAVLTGGISGGLPRNVGTWTINTVGAGTGTTPATTNVHTGSIFVPENMTLTGIQYIRGSAAAGSEKVIVQLFNKTGTRVANSALAGTAVGTASQLQQVPFTATYNAVGPAYYHIGVMFDTATASLFQTIPAYCNGGNGVVGGAIGGQTFGTAQNVTPLTTFTANQVPVASLY